MLGAHVQIARSTDEALREVDRSNPDAVVTDTTRESEPAACLTLIAELRRRGVESPVFVYVMNLDPQLGVPHGASAITNRPDELIAHLVRTLST